MATIIPSNSTMQTLGLSSTTPLLPMAYLPELLAYRYSISTYLTVGSFSTLLWDVIIHLEHDYRLLRAPRINLICSVYLLSRVTALTVVLMETLLLTTPISFCGPYVTSTMVLFNVMFALTTLLSYFRVCAVWGMKIQIIVIFGFLWLIGVAGALTCVTGIASLRIPNSPYCTLKVTNEAVTTAMVCAIFNHFATLLAITYGVCKINPSTGGSKSIQKNYRRFVLGDSLPAFSKAMLQRCQICYLVATSFGVIVIVWFYVYRTDPTYRFAAQPTYIAALNITFSWVFRETRHSTPADSNPTGGANPNSHQSIMLSNTRSNANLKSKVIDTPRVVDTGTAGRYAVEINITETVEYACDIEESDNVSGHSSNV